MSMMPASPAVPPVACAACGAKKSTEAAVCPHCGARAPDAPRTLADVELSPAELRALLAIDAAERAEPRGVIGLLAPHPRAAGGLRAVELALTLAALPVLVAGVLPIALARRALRGPGRDLSGEAAAVLVIGVTGGTTLAAALAATALSGEAIAVVLAAQLCALVVRGVVRARAGRELTRLARDE